MSRIKYLVIGALACTVAGVAQADQTRWVSDHLSTYVRSGPTDEYRIVGTVASGDRVTLLATDGDYSRIRSQGGDTVWIKSADLQEQESVAEQVPALKARADELQSRLSSINETWEKKVAGSTELLNARQQRIAELEQHTASLNKQLSQAQSQSRTYKARLDSEKDDLLMRYFVYGGSVAGAGLLLGLIVPHLPRRRKKRDRWF
ncbi:TIGR04211 family SH3 domain-containing protein [Larsenimonas rhizosphaerae]|uniref:TIGR04211 family SH3 domain-containing protein n=1 Tax=Larsenimonas rhizosphaerae TaxID=2944682 RepID=A0AA41ZL98_9GAMM|nr:TIGR04211 family SH3 domain-containing protein [Larsenimonas rhizosphaerae]MCM2131153.1 TIGR04211 family SH3 domain-containing protein [Larsenimonas rhizosphaerae]MCX2523858.1 TIGR04211 family SH3 domain-containing protein [Larsenimonas rhizosphaerae]